MTMTADERRELEEMLRGYHTRPAGAVALLKRVQERRGWISDESLREVAELVGMSAAELEGVATFYSLLFRRPVGKHVILVCDSISCWIMGGERIMDYLRRTLGVEIGETTADGEFTLLPVCCIGNCHHAPTMMIDETVYDDLAPERIDAILDQVRRGQAGGD
jgi:NADH-quinone oxidoreductase subunit E